jgi:RNA polymerase sigma-70 factor (ECF subfamily)
MSSASDLFEAQRAHLFGIAYRMLGSKGDVEDMLQDTWLRWHATPLTEVQNVQAWLTTTLTRLCIDRLRKLRVERTHYAGPWLPEPLSDADINTPEAAAEFDSDVSIAFLTVLETLTAEERAAFILHDIVDDDYSDIAEALGKTPAACRQMVHRARQHLTARRRRFVVDEATRAAMLRRFLDTVNTGDRQAILALLAEDATMVSDGGGKSVALRHPLHGAQRIAWLWYAVSRRAERPTAQLMRINGELGIAWYLRGKLHSVASVETDGNRLYSYYSIANPEKLTSFAALLGKDRMDMNEWRA